jgi:hypothetical protein
MTRLGLETYPIPAVGVSARASGSSHSKSFQTMRQTV